MIYSSPFGWQTMTSINQAESRGANKMAPSPNSGRIFVQDVGFCICLSPAAADTWREPGQERVILIRFRDPAEMSILINWDPGEPRTRGHDQVQLIISVQCTLQCARTAHHLTSFSANFEIIKVFGNKNVISIKPHIFPNDLNEEGKNCAECSVMDLQRAIWVNVIASLHHC